MRNVGYIAIGAIALFACALISAINILHQYNKFGFIFNAEDAKVKPESAQANQEAATNLPESKTLLVQKKLKETSRDSVVGTTQLPFKSDSKKSAPRFKTPPF